MEEVSENFLGLGHFGEISKGILQEFFMDSPAKFLEYSLEEFLIVILNIQRGRFSKEIIGYTFGETLDLLKESLNALLKESVNTIRERFSDGQIRERLFEMNSQGYRISKGIQVGLTKKF